jgi:hypothetical protein
VKNDLRAKFLCAQLTHIDSRQFKARVITRKGGAGFFLLWRNRLAIPEIAFAGRDL